MNICRNCNTNNGPDAVSCCRCGAALPVNHYSIVVDGGQNLYCLASGPYLTRDAALCWNSEHPADHRLLVNHRGPIQERGVMAVEHMYMLFADGSMLEVRSMHVITIVGRLPDPSFVPPFTEPIEG